MSGPQSWLQLVDAWSKDNHAGATEIAQGCAQVLIAYSDQASPASPQDAQKAVLEIARIMLGSHVSMAPVVRLLNDVLQALVEVDTVRLALDTIRRVSNEFNALVEQANALIIESTLSVIPTRGTIVTVSYSSIVTKSLVLASKEGYSPKVICLESRPTLEGRDLATFLSKVGLECVLVVDAACLTEVQHADVVLAGVDSMSIEGVVNKLGTGALALAAHTYGVPAYSVGDTSKVWPEQLGSAPILRRDPREVWEDVPPGVELRNVYYEVTPWRFLRGAVTERGLTDEAAISELARIITVDKHLSNLVHSLLV